MNKIQKNITHPNSIIRRSFAWVTGIPAAWFVVTTSYQLHQGWSETNFLIGYLALYFVLFAATFLIRSEHTHFPEVTFWSAIVFAFVGMGRIVEQLVHVEAGNGGEASLGTTLMTLVVGTISLYLFMKWEEKADRQLYFGDEKPVSTRTVRFVPVSQNQAAFPAEEQSIW